MADNLDDVEKFENEIALSEEERKKLKDFLKENLKFILSNEINNNISKNNHNHGTENLQFHFKKNRV